MAKNELNINPLDKKRGRGLEWPPFLFNKPIRTPPPSLPGNREPNPGIGRNLKAYAKPFILGVIIGAVLHFSSFHRLFHGNGQNAYTITRGTPEIAEKAGKQVRGLRPVEIPGGKKLAGKGPGKKQK